MKKVYFISGYADADIKFFTKFYLPLIAQAIRQDADFVIGDCIGIDAMAQAYLKQQLPEDQHSRVKIYFRGNNPQNYMSTGFLAVGGFETHEEAAVAMSISSDEDIAVLIPGRDKAMTAKNVMRRFTPEFPFWKYALAKNSNKKFWDVIFNAEQVLEGAITESQEKIDTEVS